MNDFDANVDYCGPGPYTVHTTEAANKICYEHDKAYEALGPSSYIYYNEADEKFVKRMKGLRGKDRDWKVGAATTIFEIKKTLAPHYKSKGKYKGGDNMSRAPVKRNEMWDLVTAQYKARSRQLDAERKAYLKSRMRIRNWSLRKNYTPFKTIKKRYGKWLRTGVNGFRPWTSYKRDYMYASHKRHNRKRRRNYH